MFPTDALALHIPNTIPRLQKIKSKRYSFQNYVTALKHLKNSFVEFKHTFTILRHAAIYVQCTAAR